MNKFRLVSYLALVIVLGFRLYYFNQNQIEFTDGQKIRFKTTILSQPQIIGSQQSFSAKYENIEIRIKTKPFPEIHYADSLQIAGAISNETGRPLMYYPEIEFVESKNLFLSGLKIIDNFRGKIVLLFSKTLPATSSSLLLGIVFGVKEQMPKILSDALRNTGVFHVIAASGMNVVLVGGFFSSLFALFFKRQTAVFLSIFGIMFYAILAGLEPSIVRASIMGVIVFSAQILGRQVLAANSLFLAGFLMLIADPSMIFDVGFQLSFAATAGILFIKPLMEKKNSWFSEILTTIAAQMATVPILLVNFGTYSIYSILVNGLVLWTVPILMLFGGIGAILGLIFAPLGQLLLYACYPLLLYFETIVYTFGKIGGVLTFEAISWPFIAGYYCLLTSVILFKTSKA